MKKFIILCLLSSSGLFAVAQIASVSPVAVPDMKTAPVAPPETLVLTESEYNFGKIPQGKPVTHIFSVKNTGNAAYKLDNVQASCGCTTPQWDKDKTIGAGETAIITVGYNAAAEGPFTKNITITYNGTQTRMFRIAGEVWKTPAASAPANTGLNDLKN